MAKVEGRIDDARFDHLRALMAEQIESGEELGASLVVNIDGHNVVDIWGGWADEAHSKPWTEDTITNMWSSTKTVATLAALIQHDRGALDVNEKVSKYWPEFAQNGKENVLVRHFLSHTSGVSGWEPPTTQEEVMDPVASIKKLEQQAPWWEPGTASGYHASNMGHLIGELIRRTSGKTMKQFVAEEIAGPLGADLQIGALEKDWPRISNVVPPPPLPLDFSTMDKNSPAYKTFTSPAPDAAASWTPAWRRADMAATNGHGNARSLARVLSVLPLGGTVDGVKLLSQETIDLIFNVQADGPDLVVGIPVCFGIGYALTGGSTALSVPWLPKGRVCFWGGWGGSVILMDLDRKLTFAYMMNKMGPGVLGNSRVEAYLKAVYKALGVEGY